MLTVLHVLSAGSVKVLVLQGSRGQAVSVTCLSSGVPEVDLDGSTRGKCERAGDSTFPTNP